MTPTVSALHTARSALTSGLAGCDGLIEALPGHGWTFTGLAAVAGFGAIAGAWAYLDPDRGRRAPLPTLIPGGSLMTSSLTAVGPDGRNAYTTVGVDNIRTAVERFYHAVLSDERLQTYFEHLDTEQLRRHQALFIGQLWGGPVHYDLDDLAKAHQRLRVSPAAYWRTAGHLMAVLTVMDVPAWVCQFTLCSLHDIQSKIIHPDPLGQDRVGTLV